jgi:hypothetical protein
MIDFAALNAALLAHARELLPTWLPGGKFHGQEYKTSGIGGGSGTSLCVDLTTGRWFDFANQDDRGTDLVSLYAAVNHLEQRAAALALGATDTEPRANGHLNGHSNGHDKEQPWIDASPEPIPEPVAAADLAHRKYGEPSQFWVYRSPDNAPLFAVARYETPDGKHISPWCYDGGEWHAKGYPKPRPLYGLPRLVNDGAVLVVEGEKTADAAARLFPENPALTWCGGASAPATADWTPLAGRAVILWPDNDDPGRKAMAQVAAILLTLNCTVGMVDPTGWPEKWDLADATPADDVHGYAAAHMSTVKPEPEPAAKPEPRMERLQTTAAPGRHVIHAPIQENAVQPAPRDYRDIGAVQVFYARHGFTRKSNGKAHANHWNVCRALSARPDLGIYYDEFAQRIKFHGGEWGESQTMDLLLWLQERVELSEIRVSIVSDAVTAFAYAHARNPCQQWLNSLVWDGSERLPDLMPAAFGTAADEYHAAVGRCFLTGMAARVLQPGCLVKALPVFEGKQDARKSTALRAIGGEFFSECHEKITSKDFYLVMQGKMLVEISELDAFSGAEISRIKGIISNPVDNYRAPYGRISQDHPRSSVFAGTTNRDDWDTDETGGVRFWRVAVGQIDVPWIERHREQLFAEAAHRYRVGEPWYDVPQAAAEQQRAQSQDTDPWEDSIRPHLDAYPEISIPWILDSVLEIPRAQMDSRSMQRVGKILRRAGYRKITERVGRMTQKVWRREA